MKKSLVPCPQLAARPRTAQLPEFEALDHAHVAAMQMLQAFKQLLARLQDQGRVAADDLLPPPQPARTARAVLTRLQGGTHGARQSPQEPP